MQAIGSMKMPAMLRTLAALALPMLLSGPSQAAMWTAPHHLQHARPPVVLVDMSTYNRPGGNTVTPRRHSPRSGGGIGISITPGILALPQLLDKGKDSGSDPKSGKPKTTTTVDIACRGGTVRRGQCKILIALAG